MDTTPFLLLQMVNISLVLTSITLCAAIWHSLGSKNADLMRARLFMMAPKVRNGILLFLVGFCLLLVWETLLGPSNPPALYAYAFDVAGEASLLFGLLSFYALVKPQVNVLGVPDDEISLALEPHDPGPPRHPGNPGGG